MDEHDDWDTYNGDAVHNMKVDFNSYENTVTRTFTRKTT